MKGCPIFKSKQHNKVGSERKFMPDLDKIASSYKRGVYFEQQKFRIIQLLNRDLRWKRFN